VTKISLFSIISLVSIVSIQEGTAFGFDIESVYNKSNSFSCKTIFPENVKMQNICWGLHFGINYGNCFILTDPNQKQACEAAIILNDFSVKCEQISNKQPLARSLCIAIRTSFGIENHTEIDDKNAKNLIKGIQSGQELEKVNSVSYYSSLSSPHFEVQSDLSPDGDDFFHLGHSITALASTKFFDQELSMIPIGRDPSYHNEEYRCSDIMYGEHREPAKELAIKSLALIDSYLVAFDVTNQSPAKLAKEHGVDYFRHETTCENLETVLVAGYLSLSNPKNQSMSSLYKGVYFTGVVDGTPLRHSDSEALHFDVKILDKYSDYHMRDLWAYGQYGLSPAFKSDERRLVHHFDQIKSQRERYSHELVIREDVHLDDAVSIHLTSSCHEHLVHKLPIEVLHQYENKFVIMSKE
jgi:hypothetical protein